MGEEKNLSNEKDNRWRVIMDWLFAGIAFLGLIICYFFWGCRYDLPVTVLAVLVVCICTCLLQKQNKQIKKSEVN